MTAPASTAGPATTGTATGTTTTTTAPVMNVVPTTAQQQAPAVPQGQPEDVASLPAWAQKIITEARTDTASHRVRANEAEAARQAEAAQVAAIRKAMGLDVEVDPVKAAEAAAKERDTAAQERDDARKEASQLKVERALAKAARKHNGDEDLLTAVLSHSGELQKLDPAATDFADKLDALVKQAIDGNGKLKTAPRAGGVSGADFTGGTGGPTDLQSRIDAATKAKDFRLAIALKQQLLQT